MNRVPLSCLVGFTLAVSKRTGLGTFMINKVIQLLFGCRYTSKCAPPRRRILRMMSTLNGYITKKTGIKRKKLERALKSLAGTAQRFLDAIQKLRNPVSNLYFDAVPVEDVNTVMKNCSFQRPLPFWLAVPIWKQAYAMKIAEGSFGEIYRTIHLDGTSRIMKFLAVHGGHADSTQKITFSQIVPDIICSKHLGSLRHGRIYRAPNFPVLHSANLITGPFPKTLLKAWWKFSERPRSQESSPHYPRPDRYNEDQWYVMLETDYCGADFLSKRTAFISDAVACAGCICQVVAALAVAESSFQFEHRDLHFSNLLVKTTDKMNLEYIIDGQSFTVDSYGYQVYIIDFTMSRITIDENVYSMAMPAPELSRDAEFDWMDHNQIYEKQNEICCENWRGYHPSTNILWIRHVIENIKDLLLDNQDLDALRQVREQETALLLLENWRSVVCRYESAIAFLVGELMSNAPYITK